MKSISFFIALILINAGCLFAINVTIYESGKTVILTDTKLILEDDLYETREEYNIKWEFIDKLSYINFNYSGNNIYLNYNQKISNGIKRYLVIYGESFVNLYDENNNLVYSAFGHKYTMMLEFDVKASSELKENNFVYEAGNIVKNSKLLPWVTGSSNDGKNEKITYIPKYKLLTNELVLIISNGFIDYNRPYLYDYNNRVKKIRIKNIGFNEFIDKEIKDTPNYQTFYINFKEVSKGIEIEILEIYKGTKYNDTCINLMLPGGF